MEAIRGAVLRRFAPFLRLRLSPEGVKGVSQDAESGGLAERSEDLDEFLQSFDFISNIHNMEISIISTMYSQTRDLLAGGRDMQERNRGFSGPKKRRALVGPFREGKEGYLLVRQKPGQVSISSFQ